MLPAVSTERLTNLIEEWRYSSEPRRRAAILTVVFLIANTALAVYEMGGTRNVYPSLVYMAILVSAFYFRILGWLIVGVVAGLALEPLLPLNLETDIHQSTSGWFFYVGFFAMIGMIAGLGFKVLNAQLDGLRHYAFQDPLTGLPNLTALREHINRLERDQMDSPPPNIQVVVFNLVNLAEIVNSIGYKKTELLIKQLARRLKRLFADASLFGRLDSNKFAAVLKQNGRGEDTALLYRLRELRDMSLFIDEVPIHVETSIGLASLLGESANRDALIPMAEIAACQARKEGLGVAVYDVARDVESRETLRLLSELRRAIGERQFLLYYQPKLHIPSNRTTGVEALIRWQHQALGVLSPGRFIPIAESTALIKPVTRWVMETALRQLAEWHRVGIDLNVAINLSTYNLGEPELIDTILASVEAYQIPQEKLTLEITESALIPPTGEVVKALARLRDRGIRIAIDDFGTGYSSLAYLKKLPVTSLKIDQSFVKHLEDERDRAIVQTAVDFGHHMDLEVVAEGVEDAQTLDFLRSVGCDVAQGYFIGRPMVAELLEKRLRTPEIRPG